MEKEIRIFRRELYVNDQDPLLKTTRDRREVSIAATQIDGLPVEFESGSNLGRMDDGFYGIAREWTEPIIEETMPR